MAINSRTKGKTGELELAAYLRGYGFDSARGQQFKGGGDSPDVTGLPGFHIEVKRVEAGNLYKWLDQAIRDAKVENMPVVIHRKNKKGWVAILQLEDFLQMVEDAHRADHK